ALLVLGCGGDEPAPQTQSFPVLATPALQGNDHGPCRRPCRRASAHAASACLPFAQYCRCTRAPRLVLGLESFIVLAFASANRFVLANSNSRSRTSAPFSNTSANVF